MKKDWIPTQPAFRHLLSWLDEGADSRGERYVEIRRRLAVYFDRRNCPSPDELADETLNRVARRLEDEGPMAQSPPARYCYITARFVFLEYIRRVKQDRKSWSERPPEDADPDSGARERLLDGLERCLEGLSPKDRDLILEYYRGEQRAKIERRRELATRRNLSMNALAIRALRIREKLEACLKTHAVEA